MHWWEWGEHVAAMLSPIASRLPKWLVCRCEERRAYLNSLGERCFKWLWSKQYAELKRRFQGVVLLVLERQVTPEPVLHDRLQVHGIRVSVRTMRRWLAEMPVKSLVMSGVTQYGL